MNVLTLALSAATIAGASFALGSLSGPEAPAHTANGFPIHNAASAPESTHEVLAWYQEQFQMVPNLAGVMAEAPALSRSYWELQKNLRTYGLLTPAENNIVQMGIALENECQYCVAGHTMAGKMFFGSTDEQLAGLRTGEAIGDPQLDALRDFAVQLYNSKGRVTEAQLKAFLGAGYTRAQALEVVTNVSAKVMTNLTNQLAQTPVDEAFAPFTEGLPFAEERAVVTGS